MFSVIYLLLCIVVGLAGRRRRIGFTGFVLLALFLTPVLPLLYLLFTQKRFLEREAAQRAYNVYCRRCGGPATSAACRPNSRHCGAPL
jgi:hypothetical protein